jgi:hypothetical protein
MGMAAGARERKEEAERREKRLRLAGVGRSGRG